MYTLTIDSSTFQLSESDIELLDIIASKRSMHLLDGNKSVKAELVELSIDERKVDVSINGKCYTVFIKDEMDALIDKLGLAIDSTIVVKDIKAPMPGLVLDMLVEEGDIVQKDSQLLILEAMKMENVIKSPGEGIIKEIFVKKGNTVDKDQLLIILE